MISVSWKDLESNVPELAEFGRDRLHGQVSYFATIRKNNLPRLHPVTPIIGEGHLYLFMEPTSPKRHDLIRGSAYVLHSSVADNDGSNGEFQLTGFAKLIGDKAVWQQAAALADFDFEFEIEVHHILFELGIVEAFSTVYRDEGPERIRWKVPTP
jgi:hypothetical protein